MFVPTKIVSLHCSDLRLELLLQKSILPKNGGEATKHEQALHGAPHSPHLFMAGCVRNFISHRAGVKPGSGTVSASPLGSG